MLAACNGHAAVVGRLVGGGADTSITDVNHDTARDLATLSGIEATARAMPPR
jgi:hypothetical protein